MTFQIGTDELAKRLHETWRQRMDRIEPVPTDSTVTITLSIRPRPKWEKLVPARQDVWRAVAEEAGRALADAMGAR